MLLTGIKYKTMQGYLYNTLPAVNTCTRSLGLNAHMNLRLDKHVRM